KYRVHVIFGIVAGLAAQIVLIVLSVVMATISTTTGVEKGIRRLSEINVVLAGGLMLYVLISGKTKFLLNALVANIGDFFSQFAGMIMDTYPFEHPEEWLNSWTLFFWAWWIAWAPFVGLFLARISRGRSRRQLLTGRLQLPLLIRASVMSIFC